MAELSTLARPYAKAAFEFARDAGDLAGWEKQLVTAAAVANSETIQKVLNSPSLTSEQQAKIFLDVCGEELTGQGQNFISILAENKRLALLTEIVDLFQQFKANQEKSVEVEISTAFEIGAELQDRLAKALNGKLNREVNVHTIVDKNLLGGVFVRAADVVIDGSVRGRLAKLAEAMNS